jgi:hypothetical protein
MRFLTLLALAGAFAFPSAAHAGAASARTTSEAPLPVPPSEVPPAGRRLSADRVLAIAAALPKVRAVRAEYPGSYGGAYLKGPFRWQVSYFSRNGKREIAQVVIADLSGRVLEQWTGFQVAWTMARGYSGAFGRHVNALYIWLPLCVLFVLPFVDRRRPFSLLHLDLLALLSFSVSLAFFNHARISTSVPLAYPPLLYLLARMLWLALRRRSRPVGAPAPAAGVEGASMGTVGGGPAGTSGEGRPGGSRGAAESRPLRLLVPVPWLALGVVFLLGFRIGLNVTDSNVIDVGYAGVIGASKIVHGRPLYGRWPSDNEHGDTYGPANYEAYVPFEQLFGWSGTWDDLPAAHAAAIVFDLLALALIFLLGLRIRGPTLAVALAYAWVSYPFTLFSLESNSNDTLVAVLVLAALLACSPARRPARTARCWAVRGVFAALAGLTKFAPLALAPLLATYGLAAQLPRARIRAVALFTGAFLLTAALVSVPALRNGSLHTIYERTIAYQANRGSPFSVWGLYGGLGRLQAAVQLGAVALALGLALVAAFRRLDLAGLAAAAAAIVIATQLGVEHWFYLYIPWFSPLVMVALLGGLPSDRRPASSLQAGTCRTPGVQENVPHVPAVSMADRPGRPTMMARPAAPSISARSNQPAVLASSG